MTVLLVAKQHEQDALLPLIEAEGYRTSAVDCHDQVLARVRFMTPAVIVVDCGLPESFHVLEHLRSQPIGYTPAIVMFSIDDENLQQKALLKGADAYVPKGSLDWAELITEIRRYAGTSDR